MLNRKKSITANDLKVGMIVANDIYENSNLLLSRDQIITESVITQIKQSYAVNRVEVYVEDDLSEKKPRDILSFNLKTIYEIEGILNSFSGDLENIFEDISGLKQTDIEELRIFTKNIQDNFTATDVILKNIAFSDKGEYNIYRHSINVAALSLVLGKWLGISGKELNFLLYAAVLHDFGKTKLDEKIVEKSSNLTQDEYKTFKKHPIIGYDFVKKFPYLDASVGQGILMHHERMDGSGYPFGLKKDKIHKFSKIIAIADSFDKISSRKDSENIRGPFEVLNIIRQESLKKLDFKYCDMFLSHMINFYIGEEVILNDNRLFKVLQVDKNDLLNPTLFDGNELLDLSKEKGIYVERFVT